MKPMTLTRRWTPLLLALLVSLGSAWPTRAAPDPADDLVAFSQKLADLADRCRAVTVGIVIPGGSMGSGVIIDDKGLVMTAAHVLPEAGGDIVIVLSDGRQVAGKALGVNRKTDAGMAQITEPGPYPFAEVAESATVWESDWCVAFGHGGGVQTDRPAPMRLGRVLHVSSPATPVRFITTDSTVISGDSGGPLFDLEGRVIGIHSNIGMSVLVNRHVPIAAYCGQWDALLEPEEVFVLPDAPKPVMPGLETLPEGIQREIARRINEGDTQLAEKLEALRNDKGQVILSPEEGAQLLGRADLLDEIRAYQQRVAERDRRTKQIEGADAGGEEPGQESEVSRQSRATRALIIEKKRERMLEEIAQDLRETHGKIADHVLSRFDGPVNSAGSCVVEVVSRGRVVALGTIVREDGYIVTKASELAGPARVRLGDTDHPAKILNGNGPNDLALLKIDAEGLTPVRWAEAAPALGSLLAVPSPNGKPLAMGIVAVDPRPIPKRVNNVRIPPPPRPYLGVGQLTAADDGKGVTVGSVVEDGPSAKHLEPGDTITAINGNPVDQVPALIERVNAASVGDTLKLTVQRGEETLELDITLGKRPDQPELEIERDDSRSAAQALSARGGKLSDRRTDFPLALTSDAVIWADQIGGPIVNHKGEAVGLNIARYGRTATYALPAEHAKQVIEQLMLGR